MKLAYLFAVIANRMLTLLCVLALSHILSGSQFGTYSIMAINALLVHTLAGNWLAMFTTQVLATDGSQDHSATFARILKAAACIMLLECGIAAVIVALQSIASIEIGFDQIAATLAFAIAMLAFDVATAAKNGLGDDDDYMRFNLLRNVGGSIFALVFAWNGGNAATVLSGQTLGIVLAFVFSTRAMQRWKSGFAAWRKTKFQFQDLSQMLAFGVTGTLALGLLILVNSLIRNFVLLAEGAPTAGVYSLMSDLFFAPLVLVGTSYSLSKMRELYLVPRGDLASQAEAYRQFVGAIVFFTVPYGVGGFFLAPIIAVHVASTDMAETASAIAGLIAAQSSILTIVFTCITILLTAGQKRKTVLLVAATLLSMFVACIVGKTMGGGASIALATLFGSAVAAMAAIAVVGIKVFPWHTIARLTLASTIMAGVMLMTLSGVSPLRAVIAALLGLAAFLVSVHFLKITGWRELIPECKRTTANP